MRTCWPDVPGAVRRCCSFNRIVAHARRVLRKRLHIGIIEQVPPPRVPVSMTCSAVTRFQVLVKYVATMLGYYVVSRPVFNPALASNYVASLADDPTVIMRDYSTNARLLQVRGTPQCQCPARDTTVSRRCGP